MKAYKFWSNVFARVFYRGFKSEELHAAFPSIIIKLESRFGDVQKAVDYILKSEEQAFYFFDTEFSRLNPQEQLAVSGHTWQGWLDLEDKQRERLRLV